MAANNRIETIPTTIGALNEDFAGRRNTEGYDENKLYHIHRRNRPFVWPTKVQENALDSIEKGYHFPEIFVNSRIEKGKEIREIMDGGNRITTFRRILNRELRNLNEKEYLKVYTHPIRIVVMHNLTNTQQREMFCRLNKNVKVTDGQKYAMSEDDSPLVKEALALLNSPEYPLRARITDVFFDTVDKDDSGQKNLENAIALVSGALYGVPYITKSFDRQEKKIENQEAINRAKILKPLDIILQIFEQASLEFPLTNKREKKMQWSVGRYISAMMYDILTCRDNIPDVIEKWKKYIVQVRKNVPNAKEAIEISGAQNINPDKLKRKSFKVDIFLKEKRLASEEELKKIKHTYEDDESDEEEDEEEEEED